VSPNPRQVLWTTCLSHGLIHVYELAVPALLILIQLDLDVGDLAMGRVVTLLGLMFGLGSLPAGYLVDRLGSRFLLTACLWGSAVSMAGMAWSPSLGLLSFFAATLGLSLSIYHPAGTALITTAMPLSGKVFATHGMAGNLGVATSSVIAGTLGALFGWRWALGGLAIFGALLGLRALGMPTPEPAEVRSRPGKGRWPQFVMLLVTMAFLGMVYRGMTTFLPKLFATRYSSDPAEGTALGGALTTAALLVGLAGMYIAGRSVDRGMTPARALLYGVVLQAPFLVAIYYSGSLFLLPLMMAAAFFHFFTQPAANHLVASYVPPRVRGLGYGIYFFISFGTGSLGAIVGGWISENRGLSQIFPAMALLLIPAFVATLLLNRRPGETSQAPPG
jgi:MFS family permease